MPWPWVSDKDGRPSGHRVSRKNLSNPYIDGSIALLSIENSGAVFLLSIEEVDEMKKLVSHWLFPRTLPSFPPYLRASTRPSSSSSRPRRISKRWSGPVTYPPGLLCLKLPIVGGLGKGLSFLEIMEVAKRRRGWGPWCGMRGWRWGWRRGKGCGWV